MRYHSSPFSPFTLHQFWETIIAEAFAILRPKTIVEIGTDQGDCTKKILQYCEQNDALLHSIDVSPDAWQGPHPKLKTYQDLSLNALYVIDSFDAVLIDGDHNWYTVINELRIIGKKAHEHGSFPAVFLHDIGWPYARRDLYYDPTVIPEQYRQPFQKGGLIPGKTTICLSDGLNAEMYHGIYENNLRSGVLTAVEDFMREYDTPLRFIRIPGMYGLGILVPETLYQEHDNFRTFLDSVAVSQPIEQHIATVEHERFVNFYCLRQSQQSHQAEREQWQEELKNEPDLSAFVPKSEFEAAEQKYEALRITHEQSKAVQEELSQEASELATRNLHLEATVASLSNELTGVQSEAAKVRQKMVQSDRLAADLRAELRQQQAVIEKQQQDLQQQLEAGKTVSAAYGKSLQSARETASQYHDLYIRVVRSRSWRMTQPLRTLEAGVRSAVNLSFMYSVFGALHDLWTDFGEPMPRFTRFVRHRILGKVWPAKEVESGKWKVESAMEDNAEEQCVTDTPQEICVVICAQNSADTLAQTVDSVLKQTRKATEIIVVDDHSSDDTENVARSYAPKGVEYLYGEWQNINAARNAGLNSTKSPFLVFLRAGDRLPADYLESCHATLIRDTRTAIAYTESLRPGTEITRLHVPDVFDRTLFEQENYFSDASMVRRLALQRVGGWNHGLRRNAEWITWRRILGEDFGAAKALSSYVAGSTPADTTFAATLCLSLSGRQWMWPKTRAFLEQQTMPHASIHLVIADTSQDEAFGQTVRQWAEQCDYAKTTVFTLSVGTKGLAEADREAHKRQVAAACSDIYNAFAAYADTPWVLLLEDDVEPPTDAFERLVSHHRDNVVSVAGLCFKRSEKQLPIAWYWDNEGVPRDIAVQSGVTSVGGNGFCCTAVRGSAMRNHSFRYGPGDFCHDHNFYADTVRDGKSVALLDWECQCKHYVNTDEWH